MSVSGNSGGFWRSVRQLPGRTPLRVKLITAVLALVTIALAAISIAGISVLKSYLLDQFDGRLSSMQTEAQSSNHGFGGGGFGGQFSPEKFTVEAVTGTGQIYPADRTQPAGQTGPDVPNTAAWLTANNGKPVTVGALSGNGSWRVIAVPDFTFQTISAGGAPGPQINGTLVIGIDVTSVYSTISRLTLIDLIVSVILLAGVAIVGVAVVRASLRPLTDIEQTAGAIAAGDLTRRVPDRDPRTEVGRLGRSLNVMLAQIETAFRARADSEAAARRSEERMRQFVADASHELRTPLTAIRGFAEYYRQRGGLDLSPQGRAPEARIRESGPLKRSHAGPPARFEGATGAHPPQGSAQRAHRRRSRHSRRPPVTCPRSCRRCSGSRGAWPSIRAPGRHS